MSKTAMTDFEIQIMDDLEERKKKKEKAKYL